MSNAFETITGQTAKKKAARAAAADIEANRLAGIEADNNQADSLQEQLSRESERIKRQFATKALLRGGN